MVNRSPSTRGRFIALEGVDGSGKSTQARLLADALRTRGIEVCETREPGGTQLGEAVRALVLATGPDTLSDAAEVYLFAAARAQHVAERIRPALQEGIWVVCDRFVDSSLAYQGVARGIGIDAVASANALAVDDCVPDLVIVIEVPDAMSAGRRRGRDRIEAAGNDFQVAVATGYRELVARAPGRCRLINGEGTPDEVHARVMDALAGIL